MSSPSGTLTSCSTQRGVPRRSWNGRERDCLRSRSSSLPPPDAGKRRSSSVHSAATPRSIGREEPTRAPQSWMRVGVRVRPVFQLELLSYEKRSARLGGRYRPAVSCVAGRPGCVELRTQKGRQRNFSFDHAFDATSRQHEIYESIAAPVVEGCLAGLNGIILAYGQTASGKSHSMGVLQGIGASTPDLGEDTRIPSPTRGFGKPNGVQAYSHNQTDPGIIPRALSRVFEYVQNESITSPDGGSPENMSVKLSLLQIYNETVQDLLTPPAPLRDNAGLNVREDPSIGFFVEGLREYAVCSHQEAAGLINLGLQQRTTAQTAKNDISSRSHTVLSITLEQRGGSWLRPFPATGDVSAMAGWQAGGRARSKLVLVDLAGSERGKRSTIYLHEESETERLREAGFINQSLSALGNVVAALGQAIGCRPHIPFRDSKLTRILADSLGGGANAALLATVGPAPQNQAESLSTLVFASRCMRVRSSPVRHEEHDGMETTLRLEAQLSSMQREFCRREALMQSRYETVVTRLAQELEYARNKATASTRPSRGFPDQESVSSAAPPSTLEHHSSTQPASARKAAAATACGGTVNCASIPASGRGEEDSAWNGSRCHTAASSSADGQTDGTESSEWDGGRTPSTRGHCPARTNGFICRTAGVATPGGADETPEERAAVQSAAAGPEPAAWEMLAAALGTLEVVEQTGAEVVRQARDAARQRRRQPDHLGEQAPTGEADRPVSAAETSDSRLDKVHVLQRLRQARALCEAQWAEAGTALSSALREEARLENMLQKETFKRRRQEDRAQRLRGALRHLLAEGEDIDCADTGPGSNGTRKEPSYRSGSVGTPDQVFPDGLAFGRSADTMTQQTKNHTEGAVDFLPP